MKKSILYKLFGFGSVPKKLLPIIEQEGIIVVDEGMTGRFIAAQVNGPGKLYRDRSESFSGCLVVTNKRVLCYTYWKRQINIPTKHPDIHNLYVYVPCENMLSISFDSANFREGWEGVIEFRFDTVNALRFRDALLSIGAQHGVAVDANKSRR